MPNQNTHSKDKLSKGTFKIHYQQILWKGTNKRPSKKLKTAGIKWEEYILRKQDLPTSRCVSTIYREYKTGFMDYILSTKTELKEHYINVF